ncbi:MAG: hypothetical protein HQK79_18065 [Desulfobacterales bacterium]|nr:hypothetical protein [Desulfobacterales bacterium]
MISNSTEIDHLCLSFRGNGLKCKDCRIKKYNHCEKFVSFLHKKTNQLKRKQSFYHYNRVYTADDCNDILSNFVSSVESVVYKFEQRNNAKFETWLHVIFKNKEADFLRWKAKFSKIYKLTRQTLIELLKAGIPHDIINKLNGLVDKDYRTEKELVEALEKDIGENIIFKYKSQVLEAAKTYDQNYFIIDDVEDIKDKSFDKFKEEDDQYKYDIDIEEILLQLINDDHTGCCKLFIKIYNWFKEGLLQKDMATQMGLKDNTFNQRLSRCRVKIQQLLKEHGYGQ